MKRRQGGSRGEAVQLELERRPHNPGSERPAMLVDGRRAAAFAAWHWRTPVDWRWEGNLVSMGWLWVFCVGVLAGERPGRQKRTKGSGQKRLGGQRCVTKWQEKRAMRALRQLDGGRQGSTKTSWVGLVTKLSGLDLSARCQLRAPYRALRTSADSQRVDFRA